HSLKVWTTMRIKKVYSRTFGAWIQDRRGRRENRQRIACIPRACREGAQRQLERQNEEFRMRSCGGERYGPLQAVRVRRRIVNAIAAAISTQVAGSGTVTLTLSTPKLRKLTLSASAKRRRSVSPAWACSSAVMSTWKGL